MSCRSIEKEDVWILNIRHCLGQVVPAARLRNCRSVRWSQLRATPEFIWSQTHQHLHHPADISSSIAHFTLTCLLFLEGYAVETLNWIWGVEIKCPSCGMHSVAIYGAVDKLWVYKICNLGAFLFVSREMCLMLRFVCVCMCVCACESLCVCLFPKNVEQWTYFHENSYEYYVSNWSLFHVLLLSVINQKQGQVDVQKWEQPVQFLMYRLAVFCAWRHCKGTHVIFSIDTSLGSS